MQPRLEEAMTKNNLLGAGIVIAAFAAVSVWSRPAGAVPISYDLNCIISAGCVNEIVVPSYGTVTFDDNTGDPTTVDVMIELVRTSQIVQQIWFNYDDAQFANNAFVFSGDVTTGIVDENNQKPDGYPNDTFDIQVPATGTFSGDPEPYTFTISLPFVDLDPSDFDFQDVLQHIFVAVHIGNCGPSQPGICAPGQTGNNSIFVGSLGASIVFSVPEPGSLSLFGAGLLSLWLLGRRHSR
jgi:hypothetical protein